MPLKNYADSLAYRRKWWRKKFSKNCHTIEEMDSLRFTFKQIVIEQGTSFSAYKAAKRLGVSPKTIYNWLAKLKAGEF